MTSDVEGRGDGAGDPLARHWRLLVAGTMAAALLLRLPWPSGWWLNPDEGIYFAAITDPSFADFWAEARASAHPPLYFLILRAIASLTTDFAWLRSVALLSGVGAVGAFIALGRELGGNGLRGRLTGLVAGLLVTASPRLIALSQVMRPYTLLLLLLASALVFLLRHVRLRSNGSLVGYAACASVALTLHYGAVGALGVFGLLVLVDGVRSGFRSPEWRRLALAQLAPGLTLLLLWAWHLRGLMSSPMAGQALEGWLSAFLIRGPADVWLGLVGVHSSLVGDTLAASATLLTALGLAWAGWRRRWTVLLCGGAAIAIASVGAVLGMYPIGATRHASWLLAFVTPVLAWTFATALAPGPPGSRPSTRAVPALILAVVVLGARPASSALDSPRRPREISEQVLRVEHMNAMSETLDPRGDPRLVVMSRETHQLLAPLLVDTRDATRASSDGRLLHLPWGTRDVIVLPGRDFAALPGPIGQSNHLYTATLRAIRELGVEGPGAAGRVLVLAGGWRSQGMVDLAELARRSPRLGSTTSVPGFIAVELDFAAYRSVLGLESPATPSAEPPSDRPRSPSAPAPRSP